MNGKGKFIFIDKNGVSDLGEEIDQISSISKAIKETIDSKKSHYFSYLSKNDRNAWIERLAEIRGKFLEFDGPLPREIEIENEIKSYINSPEEILKTVMSPDTLHKFFLGLFSF